MPQQALEFVDIVCVGEGEHAILELIERIEEKAADAELLRDFEQMDVRIEGVASRRARRRSR